MSNYLCINKSGLKIPVYSDTKKTKQIGTIYEREAFGFDCNWGGDYITAILFSVIQPGNSLVALSLIRLLTHSLSAPIIHMARLKSEMKPL